MTHIERNHEHGLPTPSAFPLVYGTAFLATLARTFSDLQSAGLPESISHMIVLPDAQRAVWTGLTLFAISVSLCLFALYIRLELFEHNPRLPRIAQMSRPWQVTEFCLRIAIVSLITLKLARWTDYSSLFTFYLILTCVFCLWTLHLRSAESRKSAFRLIVAAALPLLTLFCYLGERGYVSAALIVLCVLPLALVTMALAAIELFQVAPPKIRTTLLNWITTN